jgi:hypothetical protein
MGMYLINVHLTGVHLMGVHLMGLHLIDIEPHAENPRVFVEAAEPDVLLTSAFYDHSLIHPSTPFSQLYPQLCHPPDYPERLFSNVLVVALRFSPARAVCLLVATNMDALVLGAASLTW